MRFNIGAFNRSSFNLADELADVVYLRAVLAEEFDAHITKGANIYLSDHLNEEFGAETAGAIGYYVDGDLGETFYSKAAMEARYFLSETLSETFGAQLAGGVDLHIVDTLAEAFDARLIGAVNWHVSFDMFEQMLHYSRLSLVWYPGETKFNEVMLALAASTTFEFLNIEIDAALLVGSTLIIDTSDYSVRLDGKNIIHAHSGDWLYMTRDVYSVSVTTFAGRTAAQAGLDVRALYVERYL